MTKTGTFLCWMWGHKYHKYYMRNVKVPMCRCVRCGIDREDKSCDTASLVKSRKYLTAMDPLIKENLEHKP